MTEVTADSPLSQSVFPSFAVTFFLRFYLKFSIEGILHRISQKDYQVMKKGCVTDGLSECNIFPSFVCLLCRMKKRKASFAMF